MRSPNLPIALLHFPIALLLVAASACLFAAVPCSARQASSAAALRVTVADANQRPVPGALCSLLRDAGDKQAVASASTGEISIGGAAEQQSALIVNGLNAADPASGNFRLNLPVDSVEAVQLFQHPYTAEYGQFTGGLTSVETRRGVRSNLPVISKRLDWASAE